MKKQTKQAYSKKVMQHFKDPHNVGEIKNASGIGNVGNPVCGDIMRLYIKVKNNIIVNAKFKTFGCGAAIATSSMVTDLVKGKTIEDALAISNRAVAEALGGLPPIKMHCSVLAEQALKSAIDDYISKLNKSGKRTVSDLKTKKDKKVFAGCLGVKLANKLEKTNKAGKKKTTKVKAKTKMKVQKVTKAKTKTSKITKKTVKKKK